MALKIREVIENALDFCLSVHGGLIEFTEDIAFFHEKKWSKALVIYPFPSENQLVVNSYTLHTEVLSLLIKL